MHLFLVIRRAIPENGCMQLVMAESSHLYMVEPKAEVNAAYFIEKILIPMMLEDVPRLYGRDKKKVILHMDSARSHSAKQVYDWIDAMESSFLRKTNGWPTRLKCRRFINI
ncbi:hypothetical protein BV898_03146 [Hypsibius exemplaris]|uniref:Tc1-like transposase DDE domain-containing protein n=1 Tax=Hypsibius exemplaris TaxID=2072580 RepID=A0A1W0X776_HYPEX|nr:hypothetical protein BV898_03146 [Hypsibius exemplaris]